MNVKLLVLLSLMCIVILFTDGRAQKGLNNEQTLNDIAETYVKLVLHLGQHDEGFLDFYITLEEWQKEVETETKSLDVIKKEAEELVKQLEVIQINANDEMHARRYQFLLDQTKSIAARVDVISGVKMTFDEESKALFNVVSPQYPDSFFKERIAKLDQLLPGKGDIQKRFRDFQDQFIVPVEKLEVVLKAALDEARRQTHLYIDLPKNETFDLEFVTDKPWLGLNTYNGEFNSLIQINTDRPIYINLVFMLAAHEGYPGHHVSGLLHERHLVKDKERLECSVSSLFSPFSLIEEGTARYSPYLVLPFEERVIFEREVLFPLAGFDPDMAELYYKILYLKDELQYADVEAARKYLDGILTREETIDWLISYGLYSKSTAENKIDFYDTFRTYIVCYSEGENLIRAHLQAKGIETNDKPRLWREFEKIKSMLMVPSLLR